MYLGNSQRGEITKLIKHLIVCSLLQCVRIMNFDLMFAASWGKYNTQSHSGYVYICTYSLNKSLFQAIQFFAK